MVIKLKHAQLQQSSYDKMTCSCGKHFGVGMWSAEHRAKVYAWYREVYKQGYDATRFNWLTNYEREHGYQTPNISKQ